MEAGRVGGNLPFSQGTGTAAVAMDADGDYTIAWTETTGVTDAYYARNTGGVWSGTKRVFPLPDQPPGPGRLGVAENAAGQTVITSHTAIGIYATVLDPSGAPRGDRIFVSEGFFETDMGEPRSRMTGASLSRSNASGISITGPAVLAPARSMPAGGPWGTSSSCPTGLRTRSGWRRRPRAGSWR